ncbi:MAG: hypothetical protein ACOH14_01210 [Rhodoglobus sp.]
MPDSAVRRHPGRVTQSRGTGRKVREPLGFLVGMKRVPTEKEPSAYAIAAAAVLFDVQQTQKLPRSKA